MQRIASDYTVENTVSTIQIPSDDLKGRIVVEYDIAGDAKIVSTMDDYLNEARLRIEYGDCGRVEGGKRSLIACKA